MISLSAPIYDAYGSLLLRTRIKNPFDTVRRGSVTATLDGGVSVYDTGYSVADQLLTAQLNNPTRATIDTLRYLIAYYSGLTLSCETGCYEALASFTMTGINLNLQLRVIRRLDL